MKHSVESGIFIFFIYMIARACLSVCFTAIEQTSNFSSITNAATVLLGWFWINHILHCLWKSYITIKRFHKIDVFQNTYVYELFNSVYITYDLKKMIWFNFWNTFKVFSIILFHSSDLNECELSTSPCEQGCVNTEGSFNCTCRPGYFLNEDKTSCTGEKWMITCFEVFSNNW